jgi:hypothetical protein
LEPSGPNLCNITSKIGADVKKSDGLAYARTYQRNGVQSVHDGGAEPDQHDATGTVDDDAGLVVDGLPLRAPPRLYQRI